MYTNNDFKLTFLCPRYWPIWLLFFVLRLLNFLPYQIKMALGKWSGRFIKLIAFKRRKTASANLHIAFPEKQPHEIENLLTDHFESLGISIFETLIVWSGNYRNNPQLCFERSLVDYEGLDHLKSAQERGKGIIFLGAHFSNAEMMGMFLNLQADFSPVYRPHNNSLIDYLITQNRSNHQAENHYIHPIAKQNVKQMVKVLKQGQNLWFLPDQRYRAKGHILVPFFNKPAKSNPATSKLARMTGAVVLPITLKRHHNNRYTFTFWPIIDNFPSGNDYKDTLRLHRLYENQIQSNPAQYLWVHNRWDIKENRNN